MKKPGFVGNVSAFIAASLFGASVVATRIAVQEVPPLSLAGVFGMGFVAVLVGVLLVNLPKRIKHEDAYQGRQNA